MKRARKNPENVNELLLKQLDNDDELANRIEKQELLIKKLSYELTERKKELWCQNEITRLLDFPFGAMGDIYKQLVNIIPGGFQFPGQASCELKIHETFYLSEGCKSSEIELRSVVSSHQNPIGYISVFYNFSEKALSGNLFLPEETDMLELIAQRLSNYIEKHEKDSEIVIREARYRQLIETMDEIVFETDNNGNIRFISPSVFKVSGFTPDELTGKSLRDFIFEDDWNILAKVKNEVLPGNHVEVELRLFRKDSSLCWIRFSANSRKADDGIVRISGTITDINRTKNIETELKASDLLYHTIIEASPDVITITDLEGKIQYASPKVMEMFGGENIASFNNRTLLEFIVPDDQPKAIDGITRMLQGDMTGAEEYKALKLDGSVFDIEVNGEFVRDEKGQPVKMIFVTRDITKRKQTEKKLATTEALFRKMVETINDVIYEVSADGIVKYVSPAIKRILGYEVEEITGRNFFQYMYPDDRPILMKALAELGEKDFSYLEYRYFTKDGSLRWVRSSTTPIFENGVLVGGRGSLNDIHDRKLAEAALRESESSFRLLFETATVGMVVIDQHQNLIKSNQWFTNLLGYSINDIPTIKDWWEIAYPDEAYRKKTREKWNNAIEAYMQDKSVFIPHEVLVRCKDGTFRYFEVSFVATGQNSIVTFVDVNDRRLAANELDAQKNYTESILSAIPDLMFIIGSNGRILEFRPGKESELALPPEIFVNRNITEVLLPDLAAEFLKGINQIHEGKPATPIQYKMPINGVLKDFEARITPFENNKVIVLVSNITWRKQAEEKLRESDRKINVLMNNLKGVAYRCKNDHAWSMDFISDGINELTGYLPDDFINNKVRDFNSIIHPDDQEMVWNEIQKSIQNGSSYTIEYRIIMADGQFKWVWERGQGVFEGDNLIALEGFISDITDRKLAEEQLRQSEEKYRSLINSSDAAITMVDPEGNYMFLNSIAARPYGLDSVKMIGMNVHQLFPPEQSESIMKDIAVIISENKGKVVENEVEISGGKHWYRTSIQPVINEKGVPHAVLMYSTNVTESKLAEEKIRQSEENYRTLFVDSPDSYLIVEDGIFIECNKAAESLLRADHTEIVGKTPGQLSPEFQPNGKKSSEYAAELIREVFAKGKITFEWVHTRFDGTCFLTLINVSLMNYKGKVVLFNTWQDITEQRQAEEQLRKLSRAVDQSPISIVITNLEGKIEYVNPQACRTTGYAMEELLGENPRVLKSGDTSNEEYTTLWSNISSGNEWKGIFHNRRKNGELYWESSTIAPVLDSNGNISHYLAIKEDITERKKAEEELLKFRTISDQASYGNAIADLEGNLLYANNAFAWMHGYEVADLVGKHLSMLHNGQQLIRVMETIELLKKEGGFTAEEVWRTRKDGSVFPSLMNGKIILDSNHKPLFMSATAVDITEIKLAEEKIRQQNIRLNAIMDAMPDMFFVSDIDGNYLEYFKSKANKSIDDYSDLVGRNIKDAFDAETVELHLKNIRECLETKKTITYEYPKYEGDVTKYFEGRIVGLDENKVLRFIREITDKKQAEREIKKLTLAIEQSPVAIVITDIEANILYVSPAFYNTTGYTASEVIGKNANILKSGLTPRSVYDSLWTTLWAGKPWQTEWVNKKKNGELYWENISITPVYDENGIITSYLAIKQDITARKKTEQEIVDLNQNLEKRIVERTKALEESNEQLVKARNEAEQANLAKSEFLSRMSHELRTPLNSILGFAQLLEMGALNTGQLKGVKHIMKSGKHLLELINEILDISRIEAGRISLSIEPVELAGVIHEIIDIVQHIAEARKIKITISGEAKQNLHVKSDRQRLKQVLINIINNAVKYNHEYGSVTITTSIRTGEKKESDIVRISVTDTGPGIAEEDISKIFTPFERIGADQTATEGTGLGLAVVKKLMEAMGGRTGVESTQGQGSTFWIELPQVESQKELVQKAGGLLKTEIVSTSAKGTILYIEDNISNIELVEEILAVQRPDIILVSETFGKNAVKKAIGCKPDFILLDLNLPDIHGREVLAMLLTDNFTESIPVVILSADAMPHQLMKMINSGAKSYLTKPLDVQEFLKVVDQYIRI